MSDNNKINAHHYTTNRINNQTQRVKEVTFNSITTSLSTNLNSLQNQTSKIMFIFSYVHCEEEL